MMRSDWNDSFERAGQKLNGPAAEYSYATGQMLGWIDYMLKSRQKTTFDGLLDCVMVESMYNPIADA